MVTATRPVLFWATAAFVAAVWLAACNQLRMEWTINAQYTYGWSVPFLCAYLFGQRWGTRPPPSRATKSGWPLAICGVALAAFLLIRLVQEANPGWRLVNWAIALQAVMLTFGLLACAGGRAWVKHFAFPILFFLVAVPWPTQLESPIIQNFERADASLTVELMNLLGTPAAQRGNLIEVATGLVGIDEACSGIRSFQATLMLALFFGEFYRSTLRRRLALLAGGVAIVFLANVGRTAFLVWIAASRGIPAIERFHDSAGTSVLLIAFGLVWLLAWRINRKQTPAPVPPAADREPVGSGLAIPRALVLGGLVWMGASEILTRAWFASHEHRESSGPNWTVRWPEEKNRFARRDFTPRERAELKFSEGQSAQWTDLNGSHWLLFYMKWNHPRSLFDRVLLHNALSHRPDICLPGAGFVLKADEGVKKFSAQGISYSFRRQVYAVSRQTLYVFHCVWEDDLKPGGEHELDWSLSSGWSATKVRWQRVLEGRRYGGFRVLEFSLEGPKSQEQADDWFGQSFPELIQAR